MVQTRPQIISWTYWIIPSLKPKIVFTHLHVHSYFSLLEALPSPQELAASAKTLGMPALALTDHLCLSGAVEFHQACKENQIKPILGLEIDLALPHGFGINRSRIEQGSLVLLATDLSGWKNLCELSSAILTRPDLDQNISVDVLNSHSQGLVCLTGGCQGFLGRLLAQSPLSQPSALLHQLVDIFMDRLYFELDVNTLTDRRLTSESIELAQKYSLPVAATSVIYYLNEEQSSIKRTMDSIRLNRTLAEPPVQGACSQAGFTSEIEMLHLFSEFPKAIITTQEINERCKLDLPLGKPQFPQITLPEGVSGIEYLRQESEKGARRIYGEITPEIQKRLDHELSVIGNLGYEAIFIIVKQILEFARQQDIPTSSRGSAASSLIAHCLGITTPEPLRLNLYFERFLNPARSTPPDIDTDICSRRRDQLIQYVFAAFGQDRVAMVGTINRYRHRSALSDVAKAHGMTPVEIRGLTRYLPYHYFAAREVSEDGETPANPFAELLENHPSEKIQSILIEATAILGLPRHLSVHAGGLVISPGPLTDLVPVQLSGNKGVIITQFSLESIEEIGLVKIDLLGIRGLTVLGDVAGEIHSWQRKNYRSSLDVLDAIPEVDPNTSDTIEKGQTIGCFQIESPGMRATLKEIRARNIPDIMIALALYRPGPLKGGLKDTFVRRHKGDEPESQIHPALQTILAETHGVILYQEQVLRIAHELAGLDLADSDMLRRAMSHFDPGKQMQVIKEKFIAGAAQNSSVPRAIAETIWELMAAFAGYGFPKAHSASYAVVAWRSAWCKTHYPAEFMAAVLANWGGYYSQRVYLSEARRLGLAVKPPHINHSIHEFSTAYPEGNPVLYMGLDQIKELTHRTIVRIIAKRPFDSLDDFLVKVDPRPLEAVNLIRVGALDGLGGANSMLDRVQHSRWLPGQPSLFALAEGDQGEQTSLQDRVKAQEELLGISVDVHPLELVADRLPGANAISTVDAANRVGERVRVAGIRQSWHRSRTTRNETMAFISLEDLEGVLDIVVFPNLYHQCRNILSEAIPVLIEGTMLIESNQVEPILHAEKIWKL